MVHTYKILALTSCVLGIKMITAYPGLLEEFLSLVCKSFQFSDKQIAITESIVLSRIECDIAPQCTPTSLARQLIALDSALHAFAMKTPSFLRSIDLLITKTLSSTVHYSSLSNNICLFFFLISRSRVSVVLPGHHRHCRRPVHVSAGEDRLLLLA